MKAAIIVSGVIALLILAGWLGLKIRLAPFAAYPGDTNVSPTVPLPTGLPAPVDRFYRTVYGEAVPQITSGVMTLETVTYNADVSDYVRACGH